jgi:hypothetical protein
MRNFIIVSFFFLVPLVSLSQKIIKVPDSRVFTRTQLSTIKSINELVPDSLKDNTFGSMDMLGRVSGKEVAVESKSDEVMEQMKSLFKNVDTGTKMYVDVKYFDPKTNEKIYRSLTFSIKVVN